MKRKSEKERREEKKSPRAKVKNLSRNFSVNLTCTLPLRYHHSLLKQYDQLINSLKDYTSLLGSIVGNGFTNHLSLTLHLFAVFHNLTTFQLVFKPTSQSV